MSRPLLMIPGPIEYDQDVLTAMAVPGTSHVAPNFIACFQETLKQMREIFFATDGQPFVLAGSGTMGWDLFASNCIEKDDKCLVVNIGYFSDSFGDALLSYGADVDHLRCAVGSNASIPELKAACLGKLYKVVTLTHVDTSTGVLSDLKTLAAIIRSILPDVIIAVDGVCALGGEEVRMTDWDIDYYLTGSQKALGVPVGLSITFARPRALAAASSRETPAIGYYMNWKRWIPIMRNYEEGKPSYFATPAVSLIFALNVSCKQLLADGGMERVFREHKETADKFRNAMQAIGLSYVPVDTSVASNLMSAVKYPEGVDGGEFLRAVKENGVVLAGGLHKDIKATYFRVGHMGPSSRPKNVAHIEKTVAAIEAALTSCGHKFTTGAGIAALKL